MLDTTTGEVWKITLTHESNNVREFYSTLPRPVRVGIEATRSMQWFVNLMEELFGWNGLPTVGIRRSPFSVSASLFSSLIPSPDALSLARSTALSGHCGNSILQSHQAQHN